MAQPARRPGRRGRTVPVVIDGQDHLTTAQTAAYLGVRTQTVYAYVSRGLLARTTIAGQRGSFFPLAQVEELQSRGRTPRSPGGAERIHTHITLIGASCWGTLGGRWSGEPRRRAGGPVRGRGMSVSVDAVGCGAQGAPESKGRHGADRGDSCRSSAAGDGAGRGPGRCRSVMSIGDVDRCCPSVLPIGASRQGGWSGACWSMRLVRRASGRACVWSGVRMSVRCC